MSELLVRGAIGVLAGGAWNLASVWTFGHVLRAWLGPMRSHKRALLWLLVKFPLLYLLAIGLLHNLRVSAIGFGIGFTVVMVAIVVKFACQAWSRSTPSSHVR